MSTCWRRAATYRQRRSFGIDRTQSWLAGVGWCLSRKSVLGSCDMHIAALGRAIALAAGAAAFLVPLQAHAVPDRPTLVSPLSGSRLPALGTNLTWQLPSSTTQYHLQVVPFNGDGPGINVVHNKEEEFRIPAPPAWYGLLPDMTYTW